MYNLLVSAETDAWESGIYLMDTGRYLEHTDPEVERLFSPLNADAIAELKKLPCIFAYEKGCNKPPKFGLIRAVNNRYKKLRIQYEIKDIAPSITFEELFALSLPLDINDWELNRTHWAVKDVDLVSVLNRAHGMDFPWLQEEVDLIDLETHIFDVAFSFPGETRSLVETIINELEKNSGSVSYFYDNKYQSQLARPEMDTLLQNIYRKQSKLIVVFLSSDYERKEWCGIELHAIREIIMERNHKRIMYIRTDDGEVKGVFKNDGYLDSRNYSPQQIAGFIQERVKLLSRMKL